MPPRDDIFEILKSPAIDRMPKRLISGQIDQTDAVLEKSFTIGARLIVIALLIAVGGVWRNVNVGFAIGAIDADPPGLLHP